MSKVTRGSVGAERAKASGAPIDPSTTSRGRFSVQKKIAAVLHMMRGESLDIVSRDLGVSGTITAHNTSLMTSRTKSHSSASKHCRASCANQRATDAQERFIQTLKENLLWVKYFSTIEELRLALLEFRDTYNKKWIIERHRYKTPEQVRNNHLTAARKAA